MNTRQIVYNFKKLEEELKELKKALEIIEDEIGGGTATYKLLKKSHDEKLIEFNIFGSKDWKEKEIIGKDE